MSGGVAYVWDTTGSFPALVNPEMVDLEECDEADVSWLAEILRRHEAETGSAVAARVLAGWPRSALRFAKVMPRDYKRVLEAMRAAEEAGVAAEDAIMEAAHG
jgi:glutamate synthase (NADPH/NADH) large chain